MSINMNYELRIERIQKLVMTQKLKQAITLLQYSAVELMDYIQEEIANNPVLDVQEKENSTVEEELKQKNSEEMEQDEQGESCEEYVFRRTKE